MPNVSKKQHNLMAAVANNPKFAKKVGISKKVGEEFMKADEGRKFQRGDEMMNKTKGMKKMAAGGMPMVEKNGQKVPAFAADGKGKMAKGGKVMKYVKGGDIDGAASKGKTKGTMVKMAMGGACMKKTSRGR